MGVNSPRSTLTVLRTTSNQIQLESRRHVTDANFELVEAVREYLGNCKKRFIPLCEEILVELLCVVCWKLTQSLVIHFL